MTGDQLDFDGGATPYPLPKPRRLTVRQRELWRYFHASGGVFATDAARVMYADASGALRRLENLGLVERVARGYWRAR